MSVRGTITRNIGSNLIGYVVNVVVALFLTPFVVSTLGDGVFGLWTLIVSLTGYYGLLDFGVRSAVGEYATRYLAKEDLDGVNRTFNTALGLALGVAVAILLATVVVASRATGWFHLEGELATIGPWAILITGSGVALGFPLSIFGLAPYARQRFDISNALGITERLIHAALVVWVLSADYGLIGVALATAVMPLLMASVRIPVAYRLIPGLSINLRKFRRNSVRELAHFGFFNFLVNAADRVITHTDAIVIGAYLTTTAVTYYSIGANLIPYYISIVNAVAWTLTPRATSLDAHGDRQGLRALWLGGTRGILLFASMIFGGLLFMGRDFLALWMGERFVSGEIYPSSALILGILGVGALVRLGMTTGKQVCFGMREVTFLGYLSLAEAAANLILSLILVRYFGLVGVAIGTLVPILVAYLWLQPRFLMRKLGVKATRFWRETTPGPAAIVASMGLLTWLLRNVVADDWPMFLAKAAAISIPGLVLGIAIGTTREEKRTVLSRIGWSS